MAHNPLHIGKNPNPVVKKVTVSPFGPKVFGEPTVSRSGNTITTTTQLIIMNITKFTVTVVVHSFSTSQ